MRNLAPEIPRYRLTIEAKYGIVINEEKIKHFLKELAERIEMTPLIEPIIFSPNESKHPIHHGLAGFIAWVESGCSVYTWDRYNFLTIEIYTCKKFDVTKAIDYVKNYFECSELEFN